MMNGETIPQERAQNIGAAPGAAEGTTRLRGWPLVIVRTLVLAIVGLAFALYALALPGLVPHMSIPCDDPLSTCLIAPQQVAPLARLGLTPYTVAVAVAGLSYLAILLVGGVAALLLWRRSDDWMALLAALTLSLMPMVFTPVGQGLPASFQWLGSIYSTASFVSLYLLIALFPNGRFVPRWVWVLILLQVFLTDTPLGDMNMVFGIIGLFLILIVYGTLIGGQIYRYRRISTPVQRQQTKWVVAGIILTLVVNQAFWQPGAWIPALQRPESLYALLAAPDSFLMICILAVSFGVAMLRYRLYDIDVIIRRTLIYGSLTVILVGVYVAGVVGAQSIIHGIARSSGNETSPVLIVVTTLLIAALFQPLRRRIQRFIDRRFYRSKYDVRKTVEAFSATLRQEVDLATLTGRLVTVVDETMRPEHVSLWLRDRERGQ